MKLLMPWYERFVRACNSLQSPLLLVVRLYWGWQFAVDGWSKLHNMDRITAYFVSLNIPFASANAHFISVLELVGGVLLILGLGSRLIAFLLTCNMLVAYWTGDHEALLAVFSDPDKFIAASPSTYLFASVLILIFGAGYLSLDALLAKHLAKSSV